MVDSPRVALFVTCLVDLFRPSVGFAAVKLLEDAGCRVEVPAAQTCCGQPAYNMGDRRDAADIARNVIKAFEGYDYVVVPSGSCGGMIIKHYPQLFDDDPAMAERARRLAERTHELVSFLVDVRGVRRVDAALKAVATYHDACSGLRELPGAEVCCGFGGTFCVKYPEVSTKMVSDKAASIAATGADLVLAGDLGCLMNIAGRLQRLGHEVHARHVAEVLAGMTDEPAIGEAKP